MKNTIQLNIGLNTPDGTVSVPAVATALRRHGLILTASRIATGQWEGKEETTLAVECLPALPVCHHECRLAITSAIGKLARELRQHCIALAWPDGGGELCPPVSGRSFDPEFFHPIIPPAPVAAACPVDAVISSLREMLDTFGDNAQYDDDDAEVIARAREALAATIAPARTSEVTSGW